MPKPQIADLFLSIGQDFTKLGNLLANNKADVLAATNAAKVIPTSSKKRVKKDANAPKRNITSYLHFSNQNRDRLVRENPKLAQTEIAKLMGEEWRKLSTAEKEPFQILANQDKARFDKEMAEYKPGEAQVTSSSSGSAKKARITSPPPAEAPVAPAPTESTKSSKKHKKHKK